MDPFAGPATDARGIICDGRLKSIDRKYQNFLSLFLFLVLKYLGVAPHR